MRIFISYARVDIPTCKQLVELLEAHEVWFDQKLNGGDVWWQKILEKLEWCDGLIYLLSPESVASEFCQKEAQLIQKMGKPIIPIIIRQRTEIPKYLIPIQHVDLSHGLTSVDGVVKLLNALLEIERRAWESSTSTLEEFSEEDNLPPQVDNIDSQVSLLPFNFVFELDQQEITKRTKDIYYRWICDYLERIADQNHIEPQNRTKFLSSLPKDLLQESFSVAQVRTWFGMLSAEGFSAIEQAKSAIVSFLKILGQHSIVDEALSYKVKEINVLPSNKKPKRRLYSHEEITNLLDSLEPSDTRTKIRNAVVITCLLALRSGEISAMRWNMLSFSDNGLKYFHPDRKSPDQLPTITEKYIRKWREIIEDTYPPNEFDENSFVVRRFLKSEAISAYGITTASIGNLLASTIFQAEFRKITPEELRLSVQQLKTKRTRDVLF